AGLGARGDFQFRVAHERWHRDGVAENGLGETDGHFAQDVIAFAREDFIGFDLDVNIEVAPCAAVFAGFAFAGKAQAGSGVNAGRKIDGQLALHAGAAGSRATRAGFGDDLARAAAAGTGLRDAKKALGAADLADTAAIGTRLGLRAGGRA